MLITRECDYAIRIIRQLARGGVQAVKSICEQESVPQQYAYKILKKLEKADLAESHRGPLGGYKLKRSTDLITLYDIIIAIDDQIFLNECQKQGIKCSMNSDGRTCSVHGELCRIQIVLIAELKKKPISEIIGV